MALFFDQAWFDAKLASVGASREDVCRLLRLTDVQVAEIWKDQRELKAQDVAQLARFLHIAPAEVALKAGVSTPVPQDEAGLAERLDRVERKLEKIEMLLNDLTALITSKGT